MMGSVDDTSSKWRCFTHAAERFALTVLIALAYLLLPAGLEAAHAASSTATGTAETSTASSITFVHTPIDHVHPRILVSPPRLSFRTPYSSSKSFSLKVINTTTQAYHATILTRDLAAPDDPTAFASPVLSTPVNAGAWIRLPASHLTVPAGEMATIPCSITIPIDAPSGTSAGAIVFSSTLRSGADQTKVKVQANIAAEIVVTVGDELQPAAKLISTSSARVIHHGAHPHFKLSVADTGNTVLALKGHVEIKSPLYSETASLRFPAASVLPGGRRTLSTRWQDPPWLGWFHPKVTVSSKAGTLTKTLPTIYILPPWWLVVLIILAIALGIWATRENRRRRNNTQPPPRK